MSHLLTLQARKQTEKLNSLLKLHYQNEKYHGNNFLKYFRLVFKIFSYLIARCTLSIEIIVPVFQKGEQICLEQRRDCQGDF